MERLDIFAKDSSQLPVEYEFGRATIKSGAGLIVHLAVGMTDVSKMKTVRITERLGGNAIGRSWVADIITLVQSTGSPNLQCYDIFYQNAKEVRPLDRNPHRAYVRIEDY